MLVRVAFVMAAMSGGVAAQEPPRFETIALDAATSKAWDAGDGRLRPPAWRRDLALGEVLTQAHGTDKRFPVEGWLARNVFAQADENALHFFIFLKRLAGSDNTKRQFCHIAASPRTEYAHGLGLTALVIAGGNQCQDRALSRPVRALADPEQPVGTELLKETRMAASDGTVLRVQHVAGRSLAVAPVSPRPVKDVTLATLFPRAPDDSTQASSDSRWLVRLADGQWGASIRSNLPARFVSSGCFVTRSDRKPGLPSSGWFAPAVLSWCRAQDIAYASKEPRPLLIAPMAPALPGGNLEDW